MLGKIISPAITLLNRLNYTRKFTLLWLVSLVAIAVVAYGLFVSIDRVIQPSQRELQGLALIEPVSRTVQFIQQHRGISAALLGGNEAMRDRRAAKEREAAEAFKAMEGKLPPGLTSNEDFRRIKASWEHIRKEGLHWTVEKNFTAHTDLIEQAQLFEVSVADEYLLILDPEIASFYLIDTAVNKLPHTLEHLGQLRAYGTGILAKKRITEPQKAKLNALITELDSTLKELRINIEKTARHNPAVQKSLLAVSDDIADSARQITGLVASDILTGHFATSSDAFLDMSTAAIDKGYAQLHETLLPTAEALLKARIARAKNTLLASVGGALLAFLLVVYLSVSIYYAIIGSIQSLVRSLRSFAEGDLRVRVDLNTRDELSQVGDSFNEMADEFSALLEARKRAEELLAKENYKNETLLRTASDSIYIFDLNGDMVQVNDAFCRMLGYTKEEMLTMNVAQWNAQWSAAELKEILANLKFSNPMFETIHRRRDGSMINVEISAAKVEIDGQQLVFNAARNITERKQAEQVLIESRERLHAVIETSLDAVVQIDAADIIIGWNRQAEKIFGWSREEAVGRMLHETIIPPRYREAHANGLKRSLLTGKKGQVLNSRFEAAALHRDGCEFSVELSIAPIHAAGRCEFSAFIRDITERKRAEAEIVAINDELGQANAQIKEERAQLAARVAERTAQLMYANRAKDSFLATMSHEIRTPLGGLLGMMELLSLSRLNDEQNETLRVARNSGKSLLRIVDDILDWSKIEAGKLVLAPQTVSIPEMLRNVASTYARLASAKGILLRQQADSELSAAHILDPLRLSQILNNFTSNAIKFTEQGTVEISAKLVAQHDGNEEVRFCVKDSGVGIGKEQQERLFQHYEQASADTARMYGGTGLGLAICRSLAELMEGTISVKSALGVGSTFCFTVSLPVASPAVQRDLQLRKAREDSSDDTPAITPLVKDGKSVSVLVVDDHPINRALLKQQLELLGMRAEDAAYGIVALSLWRTGRFDLIITDCHMAEMDGYELTRSIREMEQHDGQQRLPIIAWTANVLAEEEERCRAAGMDDILTKPTGLADLRAMLLKWLVKTGVSFSEAPPAEMISIEAAQNQAPADTPIDFSVLKKIATSHAAQVEMLQEFNLYNRSDIAGLKAALKEGNPAAVARIAHRIKGASRMVGALELEGICAAIEQAAAQGGLNGARVDTALDETIERIEAAVDRFTAGQ